MANWGAYGELTIGTGVGADISLPMAIFYSGECPMPNCGAIKKWHFHASVEKWHENRG
jgi:hypothetical protein